MLLADHITCRVLGVDDVIRAVEVRSEAAGRLVRAPRCFRVADREAWDEQRRLQLQVEAWWTPEVADEFGPSLEQLPTLDRPLRVLASGGVLDDVGLFELKRFMYYATHVGSAAVDHVDLVEVAWIDQLGELMRVIHPEKQPTPRFRLTAALDDRLAAARKHLKQARRGEHDQRVSIEAEVVARLGGSFDVRGRYTAVAHNPQDARLRAAPDGKFDIVDSGLDAAATAVDDALIAVQRIESTVRSNLSKQLAEHTELFEEIRAGFAELDLLCALSELRQQWQGTWPQWGSATSIVSGRHPRLHELDDAQSVSVTLAARPVVVTGPNMGGKSMLLKLVGLCQWCAQHGFPAPAASAEFCPIEHLVYVGADADDDDGAHGGLSSFGREVRRLVEQTGPTFTLWLLDELARGTHPEEGAAIALDFVQRRAEAGDRVLAATHFPSLAHWDGADHVQIAGLTDPEALSALEDAPLAEIERTLRAAMDYTPVVRSAADADVPRDARLVARALGLDLGD